MNQEDTREKLITGSSGTGLPRLGDWRVILTFVPYLMRYRTLFLKMCLMMGVGSILALIQPLVYRHLIDDVLNAPAGTGSYGTLILWLLLLAGLHLGTLFSGIFRKIWNAGLAFSAIRDLESAADEKLDRLPMAYHDRQSGGNLLPRVFSDPTTIMDALVNLLPALAESLIRGLIIFIILLSILWWAGFLALIPIIPIAVLALWNIRYFKHLSDRLFGKQQDLLRQLLHTLSGIRLVRVFDRIRTERKQFDEFQENVFQLRMENAVRNAWISPIITTLGKTGGILIFLVAAVHVLSSAMTGSTSFTLGMLFMLLGYVWQLAAPITQVGQAASAYGHVHAAATRLHDLLNEPVPEPLNPPVRIDTGADAVALSHITFGYAPEKPVLQNVSFSIGPGEVVGLTGPSGSGKTTISNLICGFYKADSGILTLPSSVALAMQNAHLMNRSLRDNLMYGAPDVSDETVWKVLDVVEATSFVQDLPRELDTIVGEGGRTLSSGQQQRISLARALLSDAPLLILDEATSGIDLWTEHRIWKRILNHCTGRALLCISHRVHLMRDTDRILVLVNGRIAENGTHDELTRKDGYYAACLEMKDFDGGTWDNGRFVH